MSFFVSKTGGGDFGGEKRQSKGRYGAFGKRGG
jgi:hypothetical protein